MSEEEIKKMEKTCPVRLVKGDDTAFKMEVEATPECIEVIKGIYEKAGPDSKKYISKRIKTDDADLKKLLGQDKDD